MCVCDLLRYRIDEVELLDNCGHRTASFPRQRSRAAAFNMRVTDSPQTIHSKFSLEV